MPSDDTNRHTVTQTRTAYGEGGGGENREGGDEKQTGKCKGRVMERREEKDAETEKEGDQEKKKKRERESTEDSDSFFFLTQTCL